MKEIIFIAGAPGTGKSTIAGLLHKKLGYPVLDFGRMTFTYLDKISAENIDNKDHQLMSFEILIKVVESHIKYGFYPLIVNDLRDDQILQAAEHFTDKDHIIISLYVSDIEELRQRLSSDSRDSQSFGNVNESWEWNNNLVKRPVLKNEYKIDATKLNEAQTLKKVCELL